MTQDSPEGPTPGPHVHLDDAGLVLPIGADFGEHRDVDKQEDDDAQGIARPVTARDLTRLAQVQAELEARWPETTIDPSRERIEALMDLLGQPQRAYPTIHVAGTNGKTSTVRMIESLLRAFHRRTGRTTSPHLQTITERIAIDGAPIHSEDFADVYADIAPYIAMVDERFGPMSTFEVITAMAYAAFADAPVEVAVIEVGMGGTWDATNVIDPQVSVVTPIGLDHTGMLGETLTEIAGEKAGVIKPGAVAIIGQQEPEAMEVLLRAAVAADTAVARAGAEFSVTSQVAVGGQQLTIQGLGGVYEDIFLPLSGPHQAANAAVALAAVEAFFGAGASRQLDQDTVRAGFAAVTSPGRLERVRSAPAIFLDAAHNPHGARALAQALDHDFNFQRLIAVVATLGDKDTDGILRALEPCVHEVVCTRNSSPRALAVEDLERRAQDIFGDERVHVAADLPGAIELAVELAEEADVQSGAGVVITGSVVTAGDARTVLGKEPQ
ncbi:bifunctional tetrahydrofolate synthase/dihydrofolate synthase [Corynebacterium uberis]|uniref:bifunctional tetrahydrofolate synthase/dihydrofolate synthase n=1 Tax=Corynebacterium uberis TaxID=2883169 RepID=UPI0024B0CC4B|nr:folylpolyglutamate synthase/dihydrofolate synthase family protein [Corynebacterium uberis]